MGRHKEFDPDKAIDDALMVFWRKGYHDASIKDLIEGTGVNNYGLYSVFGSKRGLFLESFNRYSRDVTGQLIKLIGDAEPSSSGLEKFLGKASKLLKPSSQNFGCFVCNCMVELAGSDKEVHGLVARNRSGLSAAFVDFLKKRNTGESDEELAEKSDLLTTGLYTLGLLIRSKAPRQAVEHHIRSLTYLA